jgi:LysR family transcriptional regulator, transcriptional activator for dmlA
MNRQRDPAGSATAAGKGKPSSVKTKPKGHELQQVAALDPTRALYFSVVVEKNSVSLAAKALGVNASTVSRKLDELEHSLGVRLLERDTRNIRLTEAGESYLHFVLKAMGILEAGKQTMERYTSDVGGRLRVMCPPAIGRRFVADLVVGFGRLHPYLQVSLKLDSRPFSLADSDFDVGLCIDMPTEERAVVSKICEMTRGYVATPYFLQTYGHPGSIHALSSLPIAEVTYTDSLNDQIVLTNEKGEFAYAVTKLPTNDSDVALRAVMSGELIGRMMHWYCADQLISGELQKVMPELDDTKTIYTVVSTRKGKPRKVQLFVDFLKTHLSRELRQLERLTSELNTVKS